MSHNPSPPGLPRVMSPAPGSATKYLDGTGAWSTPAGGTASGSDKNVQYNNSGSLGGVANNSTSTNKYLQQVSSGTPAFAQVADADLSVTDVTTNNVSTSAHGFTPKLPNDATKYLDGTGAYTVPAGGGGGSVTTTGSPASGNLTKFSGATSITNGDLTGAVTTSGTLVTTLASGLTPNFAAISLDSQKLQNFCVEIINTAGTLQHRIIGSAFNTGASAYADKINAASATLQNTPTVGVGTGFTTGVGISANQIYFDTAAQTSTTFWGNVNVEYYDGNVINPRAYVGYESTNINGTTRFRLTVALVNALSGGAFTINTTNLPSGKALFVRYLGFLT